MELQLTTSYFFHCVLAEICKIKCGEIRRKGQTNSNIHDTDQQKLQQNQSG